MARPQYEARAFIHYFDLLFFFFFLAMALFLGVGVKLRQGWFKLRV
jgi:hypothetical protein